MRRSLLFSFVGIVAGTLLLTGLGTLVLSQLQARQSAETDLRSDAEALATPLISFSGRSDQVAPPNRASLNRISASLQLSGTGYLIIGPSGRVVDQDLPDGVLSSELDLDALRSGETVSGSAGDLVYAAAPATTRGDLSVVIVLTRAPAVLARPVLGWFALAAAFTMAAAILVANALSARFAAPFVEAAGISERVAAGDLEARMSEPANDRSDEAATMARSVNHMVDNLARAQGLERQFLLSISHDLRTPMTSIQGYAEALTDGAIDDPQKAGRVILSEARRLDRLVSDLLDLARLDAAQFSLEQQPTDVGEVSADVVSAFLRQANDRDIELHLDAEQTPMVAADPERLAQIIANLLDNALRYAASAITVSVSNDGATVVVRVSDDGPGIAADDVPHVFERLYVAKHRPSQRESGSGLGLAIAHELTAAMGGTIRADNAESGGAMFTLTLPTGAVSPNAGATEPQP